jgi:hypothetical protein
MNAYCPLWRCYASAERQIWRRRGSADLGEGKNRVVLSTWRAGGAWKD